MARGFRIAGGYVDVTTDTSQARKEVADFIDDTGARLDKAEPELGRKGSRAGTAYARGAAEGAKKEIDRNSGVLSRLFGKALSGGDKGGKDKGGGSGFFSGFFDGISDAFSQGFDKVKQFGQVFQKLGAVAGPIGTILMSLGIALVIPTVIALVGALIQLSAALFALPAAAAVAVAAILPLILAFKGFGEAVGAIMSGDKGAIDEALKKLAPSARAVARELIPLVPLLKSIQQTAQQGFFNPLIGQLARLQPLLEMSRWGIGQVANKLGELFAWITTVAGSQKGIETFSQVFATTARILDRLGPAVGILFSGILSVIQVGLPWVEKFFGKISEGMTFLGGWLGKISGDGTLDGWLRKAWDTGKDLWALLKEVAGVVGALFGNDAVGSGGQGFIKDLTEAAKAYKEFLQSEDGQEGIRRLMEGVKFLGAAIVWMIGVVESAQGVVNGFFAVLRTVGGWFSTAWGWLQSAGSAIAGWFSSAWAAIVGFFASAGSGIASWVSSVVAWFSALPGQIGAWLAALPGTILSFFVAAFDATTYYIGYAIGTIVMFFISLPGRISEAWASLVETISSFFRNAWDAVVSFTISGYNRTVSWFQALPGRVAAAWSGLVSSVTGFFRNAWNGAVQATISGFNNVMQWIQNLPGRIQAVFAGAGRWLYDAGRDILRGIADGINSATGFVVDAAKRAAGNIIRGFKNALGIGSPSKVAAKEVGKWIPPGIQVGIERNMPDLQRYLSGAGMQIAHSLQAATPTLQMGGMVLAVDFGDGIRQVVDARITSQPRLVSASAGVGDRKRHGWVNTSRGGTSGR